MTKPIPSVPLLMFVRDAISIMPLNNFILSYTAEDLVGYAQKFRYVSHMYPKARKELERRIAISLWTIVYLQLSGITPAQPLIRLVCAAMIKR